MANDAQMSLIGPHEGRELALMIAGQKRVAYFAEIVPEDEFAPYVARGEILRVPWHERSLEIAASLDRQGINAGFVPVVFFCLPGEEGRVEALKAIMVQAMSARGSALIAIEREIGRLLDYPQRAIDAYIEQLQRRMQM